MSEHGIGNGKGFQKYFNELLQKKPAGNSQNSFLNFFKHFRQRYKTAGKEIRISHIEENCSYMVLEDGSQWEFCSSRREIYWSTTERVVVSPVAKGGWRLEIYMIRNLDMNDEAQWTFDGYQ